MRCGLLGRKLGHSYSPRIHRLLGGYDYIIYEKEPEDLEAFLNSGSFTGLNVTIPYKKAVIPYCDELSPAAKMLGAVNTIVRKTDGSLIGHNTDYFGFCTMIRHCGVSVSGKKALVLGSGGASATVVAALQSCGAKAVVISRSGENNYSNLDRHADAAILVNATPVGMFPDTDGCPVDISVFPELECVIDLIYNPARTALLQAAKGRGLVTVNGLLMLVAQAKESSEWFTGATVSDSMITQIYQTMCLETENIALIGMPGSGKSTVGKLLAAKLGKIFIDADDAIVKKAGISIPEIFARYGESEFRKLESAVLQELGKQSGLVIATGGGCVTVDENYRALHQNSKIIWLERDVSTLPKEGRPLSQINSLDEMYRIRQPLYDCFSDYRVCNNGAVSDAVDQIIAILTGGTEN